MGLRVAGVQVPATGLENRSRCWIRHVGVFQHFYRRLRPSPPLGGVDWGTFDGLRPMPADTTHRRPFFYIHKKDGSLLTKTPIF